MTWTSSLLHFLGGALLGNAIPHLVRGTTGQRFQTPFASPPGKGLSSAMVNVLWGLVNLAGAYGLLAWVGTLSLQSVAIVPVGLGLVLSCLLASYQFGRLHGGDVPRS